jgi:thiamine biosynthesis lipoprotein
MHEFKYDEQCMGTVFSFKGNSPFDASATRHILEQACDILVEADRTFSLYKPNSPLSKLARGEQSLADCPPVVEQIWDACEAWEKTTDGWFSAFTPQNTFDPSGIVKTWAAKAAADFIFEQGIQDFTMNAGGDVWISDQAVQDVDWRVGLHKPVSIASPDAGVLAVIDLKGTEFRAVCTSGVAERGEHIWNPKAPGKEAANQLLQVSVVAKDLVEADVWATAAFAHGPRAIRQINEHNLAHPDNQVQAIVVLPDGDLNATDGFIELFAKPDQQ